MTDPTRTPFGTVDGLPVERVRLSNAEVAVELITLGAAVHRLLFGGRDVALGHPRAADYAESPFCLCLSVGRFANRIGAGRFTLDGTEFPLAANEGPNTLHGGPDGFARRMWDIVDLTEDAVELALTSPDGDQGFPGDVRVHARYTLEPDGVRLQYRATSTAPTPINLTNHLYLNPAGEASGGTDDQILTVHAARVLEVDQALIPTGRTIPAPSGIDHGRPVREVAPLDTYFVVDDADGTVRRQATLSCDDLAIDVFSDQSGMQVYTADSMADVPGLTTMYGPRAAVALESHNFPDAPNQPTFPDSILRPGQQYEATTAWRFRRL